MQRLAEIRLEVRVTGALKSERVEEGEQLLLLGLGQIPESPGHVFRLAFMSLDGVAQRQGSQVVHVSGPHPQVPKSGGSQLVRRILRPCLHDAIAGADVMQQEVAVGMDDLVSQCRGHEE